MQKLCSGSSGTLLIVLTGISELRELWVRLSHCPELVTSISIQKVPSCPWEGRVSHGAVSRCLSKTSFDQSSLFEILKCVLICIFKLIGKKWHSPKQRAVTLTVLLCRAMSIL